MFSSSLTLLKRTKYIHIAIIAMVVLETVLATLALVPPQLWLQLLPQTPTGALDGPFPAVIAPIITSLLYLTPTAIGFLNHHWQQALLYATLPAWIALGLFFIAATSKVSIFYMVSADHVTANASILEMFAVLGGIGWLARHIFKLR